MEEMLQEEDRGALGKMEEMVGKLLTKYHELKKERDELSAALGSGEREGTKARKEPGRLSPRTRKR